MQNVVAPGRIVMYRLSLYDAERINKDKLQGGGNYVHESEEFPFLIVRVWPSEFGPGIPGVNGRLFLDGNGIEWITSVREGPLNGQFHFHNS